MFGVEKRNGREEVGQRDINDILAPRCRRLLGQIASFEHYQTRRKSITRSGSAGNVFGYERNEIAQRHDCPAHNVVKSLPTFANVAVLKGDILQPDRLGYVSGHSDLLAYAVNEMKPAGRPQDGKRNTGEASAGAEVEYGRAFDRSDKLCNGQRVKDMMDIKIVDILS